MVGGRQRSQLAKLWDNSSPEIENVVEYDPDLIVVAKNGGDSVFDQVGELRKIAPVLVIDYSGSTWQDVTRKLAEATGDERKAEKLIASFEDRVQQVKESIEVPEEAVSAAMIFSDGSGAAALTGESPQVRILEQLGFTLAGIPNEVKGNESMGKRSDIIELSNENVQKGFPGKVWIIMGVDDAMEKAIEENPAVTTSGAYKNGKIYSAPGETFRLDYYSANILLDYLKEAFAK